ncbi:MAG: RHS repeat-associated core domain-containing protein [Treponema sp.]|nr:RHS repeat-associated core domain-containing protein [Treponema sp.]
MNPKESAYVYGEDGQRTNKYTQSSETLYFNKMWTHHTDSGNNVYGGQTSKNIYLGETRIVTKLNSGSEPKYQEEYYKQYYYHSDHLGSASLISDYKGEEYQRIEYTPYGEIWVEKTDPNANLNFLPYKFTAKEMDEETGLYYYGARYLDPRYSMWISTDPALGEYIPKAPVNEEAKRYNQNLPGMGGVFNHINGNLFAYAANNPLRYIDPDGRENFLSNLYRLYEFFFGTDSADYVYKNDKSLKLMCTAEAASKGDHYSQSILKYAFHEVSRETLKEISEKSGNLSLVFLSVGCPQEAAAFGWISVGADILLAADDFVTTLKNTNGDYLYALKKLAIDSKPIIAGLIFSGSSKAIANGVVKSINITIGSTGRYYEIGHRGAIKSEEALIKILAKDISSGYFGQEIIPSAPAIIDEAVKVYRKLNRAENEN